MKAVNLVLHAGASAATLEQVTQVPTPAAEGRWHPIAHRGLYDHVVKALGELHMRVVNEQHALTKDGARYFGILQVANGATTGEEYAYVLGLRNGHDKSIVAGIAVGSQVFVCDNLAFSSEIVIARKHTTFIERDLPVLTGRAVGQLSSRWNDMDKRFEAYKGLELNEARANDMLIRALDLGAITSTQIPYILNEWRHPSHEEFKMAPKNAWRWFNAVTEVAKGTSIFTLPKRTQSLHSLVDAECGIVFKRPEEVITEGTADATVVNN